MSNKVLEQWEAARMDVDRIQIAGDALAEAYRALEDRLTREIKLGQGMATNNHWQRQQIAALEAENKRLVQSNRDDQISFLRGQLREAKAENERLQAALEWYADKTLYVGSDPGAAFQPAIYRDGGQRAREALTEIEKEAGR